MGYPAAMGRVLQFVAVLLAVANPVFGADTGASLEIPSADGKLLRPFEAQSDRKATLFIFVTHDCPVANSYAPEIQRIAKEYAAQGLALFLVQADPELSAEGAKKHAAEFGYTVPILLDGPGKLARFSGATLTPEAALFAADGTLKYLGRIDDRYVDYRKKRAEPTRHDLRIAIEELLSGKAVSVPRAPAVGCFILNSEGAKK